jgi:hypothetical protein
VAAAVVLFVFAGGAAKVSSGAPREERGHRVRDSLLGTWDTGRISFDRVNASLMAAGYGDAEIRFFLRDFGLRSATSWRFDLTFYRQQGARSLIRTGWDPETSATPTDGEHARYRLLPKHRIAITSADPKFHRWREVYSYRITGRTLNFRVVGETDPTLTRAELRLDRRGMYVMAAAPLKRIG